MCIRSRPKPHNIAFVYCLNDKRALEINLLLVMSWLIPRSKKDPTLIFHNPYRVSYKNPNTSLKLFSHSKRNEEVKR